MTTSLSSLLVVAEFDAVGYEAGSAKKIAADSRMITSDERRTLAIRAAQAAMDKAAVAQDLVVRATEAGTGPAALAAAQYDRQRVAIASLTDQQRQMQVAMSCIITANDNVASSSSRAADAMRIAGKAAIDQGISVAATSAKWAAGALIAAALVSVLGAVYIAYKIVKTAIDLVTDAWDLGNAKLAEYVDIGKKAADVSTDFYQRITRAAVDAKTPVDDLTAALKKLGESSTEKLGGSDLQNRIDALVKAGNFQGNAGVTDFAAANTIEQKFNAIVNLIHDANNAGERLAALDISERAFGPALTENLRKDAEYLDQMKAKADAILPVELVSAEEIGRATALEARYDAATKILSERWHPLQNILTSLGITMKEAWVSIVESIASGATSLEKMATTALKIPSKLWDAVKGGFATVTGTGEQFGPEFIDPKVTATNALRAGFQDPNAVKRARDESNAITSAVFKDTSKAIKETATAATEAKDALDRAIDSIEKYIKVTEAAARTVDQSVFEQQKAKTIAELTAAAMRDGKTDLEQYAAAWDKLGDRAGEAARSLALARVRSDINFTRETSLLSAEDAQIARTLKGLYPDIASSLNSVEAAGIRANNSLREFNDIGREAFGSLFQNLRQGKDLMTTIAGPTSDLAAMLARREQRKQEAGEEQLEKKAA